MDPDLALGFSTEEQFLLQPYSCYVKCFSLPDLFSGKMLADLSLNALLAGRIGRLDVANACLDILRVISQSEPLAIWSQDYCTSWYSVW
ncbi:hypothetical protein [Synechococcus sp. CCY 9618]|uniref:hypothetical protein n=1 Tax=Synechococcus sp. CCY 9618 TaxID=2815602 RepID=UPI001C21C2D5|nr:hypothetical protein [Synechococcus sp. CCY 9618]